MTQPSTDWAEVVGEDEAERHASFADTILGIQTRVNAKRGPGRAFHRKQIAGLHGTLRIPSGLPVQARHGICSEPADLPVVIRLSNGAIVPGSDLVPDIRGFALSVRDIEGPGALSETTDRQDFLLINRPAFGLRDSAEFAALVPAAAKGQAALFKHLVDTHGYVGGVRAMAGLARDIGRPFTGFATSTFYSCAPIQWGPYAVHVRLAPRSRGRIPASRDWHKDMAARLAKGPVHYRLQVQFYTDEATTPIEDGRVAWPVDPVTVGVLEIPPQRLDTTDAARESAEIEADRFDPWSALADHRPLGEIMRARKAAYYASYRNRSGAGAD